MARKEYENPFEAGAGDVPGAGGTPRDQQAEVVDLPGDQANTPTPEPSEHGERDVGNDSRGRDPQTGRFTPKPTPHDQRRALFDAMKARKHEEDGVAQPVDQQPAEEPEQPPAPQKVKLRVDRREIEVTPEERDQAAQIGFATQNRLQELNNLKQELQNALAKANQSVQSPGTVADSRPHPAQEQPGAQQGEPTSTQVRRLIDPEMAKNAVRTIQLEDEDKGAEVFASAVETAIRNALAEIAPSQPVDLDAIAQRAYQMAQQQTDLAEAGQAYAKDHPGIVEDEDMSILAIRNVHRRQLQELQRIGLTPEQLGPAYQDLNIAGAWYGELKSKGYDLPDPKAIVDEVSDQIETRFNLKRPVPQQAGKQPQGARPQSRQSEKRELAAGQPRRASVVGRTPTAPARTDPNEIVNQMRRHRHQIVVPTQ